MDYENIVLDTNVLLDRPFEAILESFKKPTRVRLPLVVLEELDTFKKGFEVKNEYARAATRFLDSLRENGKLHEGVQHGEHMIQVDVNVEELDLNKPDYKIIKTAIDTDSILITQDINERVVADAVGVESRHYAPNDVNVNDLYKGYREIKITDDEAQILANYASRGIDAGKRRFMHNQFVIMKDSLGGVHEGIYKSENHYIEKLRTHYEAFGIRPKRNKAGQVVREQRFFMHLLLDPKIQFVTALGPSGCGKTLLSLAAALQQSELGDEYDKITVMRPLVSIGETIGLLPGDKLEKLEPWMGSTFDSLEFLLSDYEIKDGDLLNGKDKIYELIHNGRLELEAMEHIRGRSIPRNFLIVDDAQNLTQQQAASIITRAGEGTKVVFLGDLSEKQIDNHRLTPSSNGLAYVVDRFKGEDIVGHITFNQKNVVRSRLAQLGVEKL